MTSLSAPPDRVFSRALVTGAALMLAAVIASAGIGHLLGAARPSVVSTPVAVRYLRFTDRADGGVGITDARTGLALPTATGQNGFLRGTLRGLASARKNAGIGQTPPFRLTAWKDGRLTLDDDTNGRHVELEAFGPANEGVYASLLTAPETRQAPP